MNWSFTHSYFGPAAEADTRRHVVSMDRLGWILAFCGRRFEELETDIIARRQVAFYLAVDREMARRDEVAELEKQWNPLGRMA